jgi:hypothetical protein
MPNEANHNEYQADKQFGVRLTVCQLADSQKDGADSYQRQSHPFQYQFSLEHHTSSIRHPTSDISPTLPRV